MPRRLPAVRTLPGEVILATRQTLIAPGDAAPAFVLEAHSGAQVRLADFGGAHNLVLYFMRAFT